jgi:glycosyltransferase involved in cell wall biosynthesis
MARVSVLMPVFNADRYLTAALGSISSQSFSDFELIAIDDGSTDRSSDLLREFARSERRMRVYSRPNAGIAATRNQLIARARGDLIAWMDSDDISRPNRLERLVASLDADPSLVCVGSDVAVVDPDGKPLGFERYPSDHAGIRAQQLEGTGFRFASTMQRRSAALAIGGFRSGFPIGEDLDFLLRLGESGALANVGEVLYEYRQHLHNTCTLEGQNWPFYKELILSLAAERHKSGSDRIDSGEVLRIDTSSSKQNIAPFVLLQWARGALRSKDRRRAARYTIMALRAAPLNSAVWRSAARLLIRAR